MFKSLVDNAIKMGNDHKIEFHEIKSNFFQEIKRTIRRSKEIFFRRSKVSIKFANFFQEIKTSIRRSQVKIMLLKFLIS